MTREEAKTFLLQLHTDKQLNKTEHEALRIAIEALEQEPCRKADDYENEISDLHNRLDIAEYDKERLREEVTTLEEKLKGLSAEPSEDAISRQAAQDYIAKYLSQFLYNDVRQAVEVIDEYIGELPPVTPQPKTGHWIDKEIRGSIEPYCSVCGDSVDTTYHYKYCPNCGIKMQEAEE